ncbi:MAG: CinA family nicotinamide mononucleotide deamidase-related protein [Bacteroidales bacterium]|nr:CinA family nicotinamide mononucleotide deamidase-related protein [Bacteroidales bacterium]
MIQASICTIGDEILIGQVIDTNSSRIATALEEAGIRVTRMLSIGDNREEILSNLRNELEINDIVITTGGLGPTKDDITKGVLAELSGSKGYVENPEQLAIVQQILHSRGLDMLEINRAQALVPDRCEVIPNRLGTAPVMVFRFPEDTFGATLFALPGVPFEAIGALPSVMEDIRAHYPLDHILHHSVMVYGIAESALSELIAPWEDALPKDMHLAYLPNPVTGIRLRLSIYGGEEAEQKARVQEQLKGLEALLGELVYSDGDDTLQATVGRLLKAIGKTVSTAESCTGGMISHLITSVPGASAYYLGSVISYAVSVKKNVLGIPAETIQTAGVVSSTVAAAMAEGVRRTIGTDYAVSTTGLAGPDGDEFNPVGTVWIGVAGPNGTKTVKKIFKNDRKRNIERFAASALDELRKMIISDLK